MSGNEMRKDLFILFGVFIPLFTHVPFRLEAKTHTISTIFMIWVAIEKIVILTLVGHCCKLNEI